MSENTFLSPAAAARLVETLVFAAQDAEFWADHGRRGDGNRERAMENLKAARRDVMRALEGRV